jgi:DNA-binding transcriptional LysR family regulator
MKSLDLGHLRSLEAIVDCGGFSKAAAVLHISQPALSQHIRLLERELGLKLFDRHGRGVQLTTDGERVLIEARRLLAAHDQVLNRLRGEPGRSLAIGSTEHSAELVMRHALDSVRCAYPDARVRFQVGRSVALIEAVQKGRLDLAFILNPGERRVGLEVAQIPLGWFAAPCWDAPEDADAWPLVAFEEPCALRRRAVAVLAECYTEVAIAVESTTLDGALAATRMGLGVALLPIFGAAVPPGIERRIDLPSVGDAALELVIREGLDPEITDLFRDLGRGLLDLGTEPAAAGRPSAYTN